MLQLTGCRTELDSLPNPSLAISLCHLLLYQNSLHVAIGFRTNQMTYNLRCAACLRFHSGLRRLVQNIKIAVALQEVLLVVSVEKA
jgi:serine acetyltransferase